MIRKNLLWISMLVTLSACSPHYYQSRHTETLNKIGPDSPADSSLIKVYQPYKLKVDSQMNRVIGYSEEDLQKALPESKLGNFFSDAIAETVKRRGIAFDFAMPTTNGGIRTGIPKGDIKVSNIFELMPFENELVVLTLKGSDVQSLADFIVGKNGQPVSGIRIEGTREKAETISIGGEKLNINKTYRVLTSDYLAGGGDGIEAFKRALQQDKLGIKVRDAIMEYIQTETQQGRTLNPQTDGRIRIQ